MPPASARIHHSFESARECWATLEQRGQWYPFQSFAWLELWQRTIGIPNGWEPWIIELALGESTFLFPLGTRTVGRLRRMEWLGYAVSDYAGPLYDQCEPALVPAVLKALRRIARKAGCDMLYLDRIPAFNVDGSPNPFSANTFKHHHYAAYAMHLDAAKPPLDTLTSKERYTLRRAEKKLAEKGPLHFVAPERAEEKLELTRHMIEQKRARFRQMQVRDNFEIPGLADFYLKASQQATLPVSIHALMRGTTPLAIHWGLARPPRFYYLMPSFSLEPDTARYSPGNILLQHLFATTTAAGFQLFDFANGDEAYKKKWCDTPMPLFYYRAGLTPKGHLHTHLSELTDTLKRGLTPFLKFSNFLRALRKI